MNTNKPMPPLAELKKFYKVDFSSPSGITRIKTTRGPNGRLGPVISLGSDGYWRLKFGGEFYRSHRVIYYMEHQQDPGRLVVDHIDGNPLNNRIGNLRVCTQQENLWNAKGKRNGSGLPKGITALPKGRFQATVLLESERHVWVLDNLNAAICYLRSVRARHHGEFARA